MKYKITQPVGRSNEMAFVNLEKGAGQVGFSISVEPFISEICRGNEKITHRYNALSIFTPYEYQIRIEKIKRNLYRWFPDNPEQAAKWYAKKQAKFNLGRAAVTIDSKRRVITIHISSSAIIQKESD